MSFYNRIARRITWGYVAAGATAVAGVVGGLLAAHYFRDNPSLLSGKMNPSDFFDRIKHGHVATNGRAKNDMSEWTKEDLYEEARKRNIEGRSSMTKDELVEALAEA